MIVTRISFTKPLGNIRVDFPFGDQPSYEVAHGHVALTAAQAEEAEQYGWKLKGAYPDSELVQVERSAVAYQILSARHAC
jgi:hypothetical protein